MPKFAFQAKNSSGQLQMGQMEAASENEVRIKLRARNLEPVKVMASVAGGSGMGGGRVSTKDLQIFTRQLSTLVNAGIPIVDSLKLLSEGRRNPILKAVTAQVKEDIEGGKRLAEAMARHPQIFDRLFINMIRAGEEAGILDGILDRLSVYLEKSEKIKKQVKGALAYPIAIIVVAGIVVTGILVFIIPKFQELYSSAGRELPGLTKVVIALSQFMIAKWWIILGVAIGAPILFLQWVRTEEGKDTFDRFLIQTPLFGELVQKQAVARMSRTLATLLTSGVSVIDALEIASKTSGNSVVEEALIRSKEAVTTGKALAMPLAKEKMIPEMVTQMISIGEQSGTLEIMFNKIADFYEDDVEQAVKALMSMIEPLLMVFLGGTIAFLVLAMYLPIFDISSVAGG